jgi:methanogenic corrinoid protein MtbC1
LYETMGEGSEAVGKAIAKTMYKKLGWEFIDVGSYQLSDHWEIIKAKAIRDIVNPTETQIAQVTMRRGNVGS